MIREHTPGDRYARARGTYIGSPASSLTAADHIVVDQTARSQRDTSTATRAFVSNITAGVAAVDRTAVHDVAAGDYDAVGTCGIAGESGGVPAADRAYVGQSTSVDGSTGPTAEISIKNSSAPLTGLASNNNRLVAQTPTIEDQADAASTAKST